MGRPSYDGIIKNLRSGIYKITHLDRNGKEVETYATMNEELARNSGFYDFILTDKRLDEDRKLGMATVGNLQDKKYNRIDLNGGKVKSMKRVLNNRVPSRTVGYDVVKVSYEEILTMLIRGKLTVKYVKNNNTHTVTATRNPQIIKTLSTSYIEFGSLVADKKKGVISVFDCDTRRRRIINYRTLLELVGFEGPEDSQVRVIHIVNYRDKVEGLDFNVMGHIVSLDLDEAFKLIGTGICVNAKIERNKIRYSTKVPTVHDPATKYTTIENVQNIISERVKVITGESQGVMVVADKKAKDLTKLITLLNTEYGYDIPMTAKEIQIEFR